MNNSTGNYYFLVILGFSNGYLRNLKKHKILKVFSSSYANHFFFVSDNEILYGVGWNNYNQLGTEKIDKFYKDNVDVHKINFFSKSSGREIKKVSCGFHHTLFQDKNNQVYSAGNNFESALCRKIDRSSTDPKKIEIPKGCDFEGKGDIIDIFAGGFHSYFLFSSLEVFSCGKNDYGELGIGKKPKQKKYGSYNYGKPSNYSELQRVSLPEKVISLSCGKEHTFFISSVGNIYGCGSNACGQLGFKLTSATKFYVPLLIPFFKKKGIIQIACGCSHSIFLSSRKKVYCSGINSFSQLGISTVKSRHGEPIKPFKNLSIKSVYCGGFHTLFVTTGNRMLICGANSFGQLGFGHTKSEPHNTYDITSFFGKKIIQPALLFGTSIFFTAGNQIFAFGSKNEGQIPFSKYGRLNPSLEEIDLGLKLKRYKCEEDLKEDKERFEYITDVWKSKTVTF